MQQDGKWIRICKTLQNQNLPDEIFENIKEKEKEIKNIQNLGNLIRVKNNTLNKIYSEGKQIDRKEELHKGISKFVFKIKSNNIEYTGKQDILNEIQNFYQDLYTSHNIPDTNIIKCLENFNPPTLNEDQKEKIGSLIKDEEIDEAIKSLDLNKSPWIDGITAEFYQNFWPILTPILAELYNNFFLHNNLTKKFKQGIITLIFKNKDSRDEIKK